MGDLKAAIRKGVPAVMEFTALKSARSFQLSGSFGVYWNPYSFLDDKKKLIFQRSKNWLMFIP